MSERAFGKPSVLVVTGYGINSQEELGARFSEAGAHVDFKHLGELIESPNVLDNYQGLGLPGGFSGGDHLGAGQFLANLLSGSHIRGKIEEKLEDSQFPVYAVCNFMQILAKLNLFPVAVGTLGNDVGKHQTGYWDLFMNRRNDSVWLSGLKGYDGPLFAPISHGEGRIYLPPEVARQAYQSNLVAFMYYSGEMSDMFRSTRGDTYNPNGSTDDIAGLAWNNNLVLFPHFERLHRDFQRPDREDVRKNKGTTCGYYEPTRLLFKAVVDAMR